MADNPYTVQVVNPMQALLLGQQAYDTGQKRQKEAAIEDARQQAGQMFAAGDHKSALSTLLGAGDYQGANLAANQLQQQWTQQHTAQTDARAAANDTFNHGIANANLKIAQANLANNSEGPEEVAGQRANAAGTYGLKPGTPEYQTYALTGKLPDSMTAGPEASVKSLTPGGELYHLEGGRVIVDHKNDKAASADDTPQSTIDFLADRTRLGDQKHLVGLSRVPGLVARVQTAADQREAAGIPVSEEAKSVVNNATGLGARRSAENNLAGINNRNEVFGNNALGALDIAVKASADVPRTQYPGVNVALNAYRTGTGDPKTVALGAALNTVVNDYARFAGGGIGSDALRGEAERILNQAHNHDQVVSIANMMRKEILRGQQSPGMVRGTYDTLYGPQGSGNKPQGNKPIPVQTPQQAMSLPPGTAIILPDGSPGIVPQRPQ